MAASKLPWDKLWPKIWSLIPEPFTDDRLIVALDDFINPKTGKNILAAHTFLIMPPNQIKPNIVGHKMWFLLACSK